MYSEQEVLTSYKNSNWRLQLAEHEEPFGHPLCLDNYLLHLLYKRLSSQYLPIFKKSKPRHNFIGRNTTSNAKIYFLSINYNLILNFRFKVSTMTSLNVIICSKKEKEKKLYLFMRLK